MKLNGLPFRASEREIEDWLAEAADPLEVVIEMDRLANHRNGWKTLLTKGWGVWDPLDMSSGKKSFLVICTLEGVTHTAMFIIFAQS